eukprot:TRINITY_DN2404_c0_g1_i4.p1 TRINITY_DN2404_c0_g1~~TRINITY_DN2404_c0_g1_i4.p1  ORF type:complete len:109 (-),score=31.38 TRINITY_DN2404_c0_g1_i4:302-628(-)
MALRQSWLQELKNTIEKEKLAQADVDAELDDRELTLRNYDKKLSDIKTEISESRKKAREVNEALAQVSELLQSQHHAAKKLPQKDHSPLPTLNGGSRPISGKKKLPSG